MARPPDLDRTELDPTAQSRVSINAEIVQDHAERMRAGVSYPPIDMVWDREAVKHWL